MKTRKKTKIKSTKEHTKQSDEMTLRAREKMMLVQLGELYSKPMPPVDTEPVYEDGQQKSGNYRADRLPMLALLKISILLEEGAKRHQDEDPMKPKWLGTPVREHLNRAMVHIFAYFSSDKSEDHLTHAACRLLFALHCDQVKN